MALPRAKLGVSLFRHPCRKPLPRGEGLCMLGWLCISAIVVVCCRCVLHRLCSTTCMRPCIEPLGIYARHPCRGYITGATALTKQGCLQSATQSHCTMQQHKWLTTCTGAPPQSKDALVACQKFCTMQNQQSKQHSTPPFLQSRVFNRLIIYLLYNGIVWGIAWGLFGKNEKCLKFYLKGLRKAVKYVILIVYGN